ncbi:hypothetical protein FQN52_005047 [Onygenales sp. PD_12]|nr:hypothetical protein FQN52_005047 [Onygenales sp. PD_12]KAK2799680.1 hypothetical protein FQN51_006814 [Onygenales sp. PD_10]
MQIKAFPILALAATAIATGEPAQKRDIGDALSSIAEGIPEKISTALDGLETGLDGLKSDIGAAITGFIDFPPSILSDLATITGLPTPPSDLEGLSSYAQSLASDINDGTPPAWFTGLPSDAQSYLQSQASALATALPTGDGASPTSNPGVRPTGAVLASIAGAAGVLGLAIAL